MYAGFIAAGAAGTQGGSEFPAVQTYSMASVATAVSMSTVLVGLMVRSGLVAAIAFNVVGNVLSAAPLTLHLRAWFGGVSLFSIAMIGVLAGISAWLSHDQPIASESV